MRKFKVVCKKCGSEDVIIEIIKIEEGKDKPSYVFTVNVECNSCREIEDIEDWVDDLSVATIHP